MKNVVLISIMVIITILATANFIFRGIIPFASAKRTNNLEMKIDAGQKIIISIIGYFIVTILTCFL